MSKGSHQCVRMNTGIVLKQVYLTFIKDILQSTLRKKLHVEIKTTREKPGGLVEVSLVGCGEKPQFEEAKVLIGKTVKMTEENWKNLKGKAAASMETEEIKLIDLEDSLSLAEISSDDDELLDNSKENRKELPKPTIVSRSSQRNALSEISSDDDELLDSLKENRKELPKPTIVGGSSQRNALSEISSDDDELLDISKENRKAKPTIVSGSSQRNVLSEISSDDDELLDSSKENRKELPKSTIVCGSSEGNELCTVVIDTTGGPIRTNPSETVFIKNNRNEEKNLMSCIRSCSDNTTVYSSYRSSASGEQQSDSNEDFEPRKGNVQQDDTIVLDNETILISSDNDSEDDVLVEKIVRRMTTGVKNKKKKKKQKKSSLFSEISTNRSPEPSIITKKKRKSKDSVSPLQRSSKISKTSGQSDVASSSNAPISLLTLAYPGRDLGHLDKEAKKLSNENKGSSSRQGNTPNTGVGKYKFDNNVVNASKQTDEETGLRPIIIDSSNVARTGPVFHFKKLESCITYFRERGHKVIAFLPRHMTGAVKDDAERARLWKLEEEKVICFTPSRKMPNGKRMAAYDDRFIVQAATELQGVIVSNDNFRDVMQENEKWKETIAQRLLMFTWVGDMLMFPNDPLGRNGPHLEEFLRFPKKGN